MPFYMEGLPCGMERFKIKGTIKHRLTRDMFNQLIGTLLMVNEMYPDSDYLLKNATRLKEKLLKYTAFSTTDEDMAIVPFFPDELTGLVEIYYFTNKQIDIEEDYFSLTKENYKQYRSEKVLQKETDIALVKKAVQDNPDMSGTDIAKLLNLSSSFVYKHWN